MAEAPKNEPQAVRPMTAEEIRQNEVAQQAEIDAQVAERQYTEGPEGGRYKVGDDFVDAEGKPVKAKKD